MLCTSSRGKSKPRMVKGYTRKYARHDRTKAANHAMHAAPCILQPRPLSDWAEHRNYF